MFCLEPSPSRRSRRQRSERNCAQINNLPDDHIPSRRSTRQRSTNNLPDDHNPSRRPRRLNDRQADDLPEDLYGGHTTAPGQSRRSRRQRTINYNDQDDEDVDLVPGPLFQENNQDTVNMLSFLLYV